MTPQIAIVLPVEGAPLVRLEAMNEGEEQRMVDWIDAKPEYGDLVRRALELAEEARAA